MSTFIRLTDYKSSDAKEEGFFKPENRYQVNQEDFEKIPSTPIAYWVSDKNKRILADNSSLGDISEPRPGLQTSDNDRFLKLWYEVEHNSIGKNLSKDEAIKSEYKWFPHNKGGKDPKKWYGNIDYLINFYKDGEELKHWLVNNPSDPSTKHWSRNLRNYSYYFQKGITWSAMSSNQLTARLNGNGFLFDTSGPTLFGDDLIYLTAYINCVVFDNFVSIFSQTLSTGSDSFRKVPIIFPKSNDIKHTIETITQQNIDISKEEWDSRETSWDFKENGLLRFAREIAASSATPRNDGMDGKIESAYNAYCNYWREKFTTLHANEEELNRLFIDIYELQDELTPDVALKDITIIKQESDIVDGKLVFDAGEIMKQFISYGVGVMFGRYSLDKEGLQIANLGQYEEWIASSQASRNDAMVSFEIDDDNVIPVLEDDYFSDDIASRVVHFVKVVFGQESLSANIAFIEKCLGKTIRAYMVKDFYEDHIRRYKKRPIYWMVASPKKGFMSLSYMHRYKSDLFALVQNNYLREYIAKLEATKEILNQTILSESANSKDKKEADKRIKAIDVKLKELFVFDRDVLTHFAQQRVEIDLDDGVKVNYCKFSEVLYEIKGLC